MEEEKRQEELMSAASLVTESAAESLGVVPMEIDWTPEELNLLHKMDVGSTSFSGIPFNTIAGLLYFLKTHRHACSPLGGVSSTGSKIHLEDFELCWMCNGTKACDWKLHVPDNFVESFKNCLRHASSRFIFGLIHMEDTDSAHANAWLYDKFDNSVEFFEPHGWSGSKSFNVNAMYDRLQKFFVDNFNVRSVSRPYDFCPSIGIQKLQSRERKQLDLGYCAAWSLWWIDYRLSNADSSLARHELLTKAVEELTKNRGKLTRFIRNYGDFIVRERNRLLEAAYKRMAGHPIDKQRLKRLSEMERRSNTIEARMESTRAPPYELEQWRIENEKLILNLSKLKKISGRRLDEYIVREVLHTMKEYE